MRIRVDRDPMGGYPYDIGYLILDMFGIDGFSPGDIFKIKNVRFVVGRRLYSSGIHEDFLRLLTGDVFTLPNFYAELLPDDRHGDNMK